MDIDKLRAKCSTETIEVTTHVFIRILQRSIVLDDITNVIMNGEIIEDYPDDYPFPSCLVLGQTRSGRPIHIVAGLGDGKLWLVTAYEPDAGRWESDNRTRKV